MVTLHCSFKRSVSLIIDNWSELSLLRFHPNKCWLLITIIKHHYQRERWWQSSHGWLHCMTTASGRQRRQTCQAFSHNFSQITISIYLNPLDNQASINKQSSIRSENFSTFPRKFLVCDQPWMKFVKNIRYNCTKSKYNSNILIMIVLHSFSERYYCHVSNKTYLTEALGIDTMLIKTLRMVTGQ